MISINDYLYNGDTVFRILHNYADDLKENARKNNNPVDRLHCNFLLQIAELLEHNNFLTDQSARMREFYVYLAKEYPYLAFTFKGRIKSLIRAEEKFNNYVVSSIYKYYKENGTFPPVSLLKNKLSSFRDLIAYRIVISIPKCHLQPGQNQREEEIKLLYEIANKMPDFVEEHGFTLQLSGKEKINVSPYMDDAVRPYFRDYVVNPSPYGYQSLHITFYDNSARCLVEVQLRTKEMDDIAEIGPANHLGYEKRQEAEHIRRDEIPEGQNIYFDEAFERNRLLHSLELSELDVNMFAAVNNSLINDGCGLYRGRQITPFEHLSRFQTENSN